MPWNEANQTQRNGREHAIHIRIRIFGNDGTQGAYQSIKAGELTGTVDIFPVLIGTIGLDVAERLSVGQSVPRVVEPPQAVVTRNNMARCAVGDEALQKALADDEAHRSQP